MSDHICDDCNKEFARKYNLTCHEKNGVCKGKAHRCKYCGSGFTNKTNMHRHMRLTCAIKKENEQKLEGIYDRLIKLEDRNEIIEKENELLKTEVNVLKCNKTSKFYERQLISIVNTNNDTHDNYEQSTKNTQITKVTKNSKYKIPQKIRMRCWEKNIGDTISGKCYSCNDVIKIDNYDCGHIVSRNDGGAIDIDNLKPICRPCNLSSGTMNLDDYKELMKMHSNKT